MGSTSYYEVSIGSNIGSIDIKNWERFDTNSGTIENLKLELGSTYYVNVRAVDYAGNESEVASSNGFIAVEDKISSNCHYKLGKLKCWGSNANGQLGQGHINNIGDDPGEMGDSLLPIELGTNQYIKQISGSCVLFHDGRVKCWGRGSEGKLGQGNLNNLGDDSDEMGSNLPYIDLGTGRTAKMLAANSAHACVILDDDSVKCWGENEYGGLGYGHSNNIGDDPNEMGDNLPSVNLGTDRTAKFIDTGSQFSCAILDDDSVKCWGKGGGGRLGQGDTNSIGDDPNEMGDNLLAIDLGTGRTAKTLSVYAYSACAVLDNYSIKCWGNGTGGHLGQGNSDHIGGNPGEMGDIQSEINLGAGRKVKQLTKGRDFVCTILDNDSLKCWGRGDRMGLGYGNTDNIGDNPGEMGDNLQTIDLGTGRYAVQIKSGEWHACAMLDDNSVKCWGGFRGRGNIGSGSTEVLGDDPGEMGENLLPLDL